MEKTKRNFGFTLVELVVVLIIAGIIGVYIAIRISTKSFESSGQTKQIISNIRYAQSLAMSANMRYRVYFYTNTYKIASFDASTGTESFIFFPIFGTNTLTLLTGESFVKGPTPDCVAFNGKGQPCDCSNGSLLTSDTVVRLQSGSLTNDITITAQTGYVS